MNNKNKIIYRVVTVLFSIMILIGTALYFVNHDLVAARVSNLGYPSYIVYPLGVLKILGLVAIWRNKSRRLIEWAYAGFVYVLILGVFAHLAINDNEHLPALISLILGVTSYMFYRKKQGHSGLTKDVSLNK